MGTHAVLSIESNADGSMRWSKAICMTVDGFMWNLRDIAENYMVEMNAIRGFDGDVHQTNHIMKQIVYGHDVLFIDDRANASWVSYSAQFNPFTKTLTLYEGNFETKMMRYRFTRKRWVAESLYPEDVLFEVSANQKHSPMKHAMTEKIYAKDADEANYLMGQFYCLGSGYNYVATPVKVRAKVAA